MPPTEIFLSHASADHDFTLTLVDAIRRHGIPAWHSHTNILGAQHWHDAIGAALRRCDWFLVVLSPSSVKSMWVKRELVYALQQDRLFHNIIPVLYQPCDPEALSWTLLNSQVVDFTRAFEDGCRDLLRIWGLGYQPR